ncbi:MAG: hypothetical protein U9P81_11170 [Euryarchaeota archaeon]|nr:hypothetical protein [Euryarchaeota archaeon]
MIRVLVVDDSAFMRKVIKDILEGEAPCVIFGMPEKIMLML